MAAADEAGRHEVIREVHREFALSMRQVAPLLGVAVVGAFGMHFALAMHAANSGDAGDPEREAADIADLIVSGYQLHDDDEDQVKLRSD